MEVFGVGPAIMVKIMVSAGKRHKLQAPSFKKRKEIKKLQWLIAYHNTYNPQYVNPHENSTITKHYIL